MGVRSTWVVKGENSLRLLEKWIKPPFRKVIICPSTGNTRYDTEILHKMNSPTGINQ